MDFRTIVTIEKPSFTILPRERMLFVGSCFADRIGKRFQQENFPVVVNPYGVMYNPASILHTIERTDEAPRVVFLTLGTNHVYRLRETGEIVDNCQKKPQRLFHEECLSVEECVSYLSKVVGILQKRCSEVKIILTVSPIRYAKYGFHGSQLSKATLLLATAQLEREFPDIVSYFPAYEIVCDELRDYRFYNADMIHPSDQAVEYIWERLAETYFADDTYQYLREWKPIKEALAHRPFNPESPEYKQFIEQTHKKAEEIERKFSG